MKHVDIKTSSGVFRVTPRGLVTAGVSLILLALHSERLIFALLKPAGSRFTPLSLSDNRSTSNRAAL